MNSYNYTKNIQILKNIKLLLFWPIFGMLFFCLEKIWIREQYFSMYCFLDDIIPFCEYFVIPYMFWFVFLAGIHIYTFFFEMKSFEKLMQFIIITYSIALLIYIVFPNKQLLRPSSFENNNMLTQFMISFYRFDTNTNVCPSLHVVGSVAVMLSAWNSEKFKIYSWKIIFAIITFFISISTVFLKQHSIIDVIIAIIICIITNNIVYRIGLNDFLYSIRKKMLCFKYIFVS